MLLNGSLDRYKNIWLKYVPYFHGIMFYRLLIGVIRLRLPRERIENRLYMSPVSPVFHTEVRVNLLKTFCLGTRTYYYQIITKEYEANTQYMLPKSFNIISLSKNWPFLEFKLLSNVGLFSPKSSLHDKTRILGNLCKPRNLYGIPVHSEVRKLMIWGMQSPFLNWRNFDRVWITERNKYQYQSIKSTVLKSAR